MTELRFMVPGISCRHCAIAVTSQVARTPGVETVEVEPGIRWVVVHGHGLDIEAIRAAVAEAGHEAEL